MIVLGDACADLIVRTSVDEEDTKRQFHPEVICGGSAANTAMLLARLGVPVAFVGAVGRDSFGNMISDQLSGVGVDTSSLIHLDGAFTTVIVALIALDGTPRMMGWPRRAGADKLLDPLDVDLSSFEEIAWFHSTGVSLVNNPVRETVSRAMEHARNKGVPISLDLNLRLGLVDGVLAEEYESHLRKAIDLSDYVFGSATDEIALLCPHDDTGKASESLAGMIRTVVSRRGELGAICASGSGLIESNAFDVDVVDSMGAGDAFNAGFITAQLDGLTLAEALEWGNATAGMSLKAPGTSGVFDRDDIITLIRQQSKLTMGHTL